MNHNRDIYDGQTQEENCKRLSGSFVCTGITGGVIETLLREDGCDARIIRFENSIVIQSSTNGSLFLARLRHYDEKLEAYRLLSLSACYKNRLGTDIALSTVNGFNQNFPLINAQLIHPGKVRIKMDLLTGRGVALAQVAQWLRVWRVLMMGFEDHWYQAENKEHF